MVILMMMTIMIITGLVRGESLPVAPPTGVKDDNDHSYDDYDSHDIMMMTTIKFTGLVRGESLPVAPPTGVKGGDSDNDN